MPWNQVHKFGRATGRHRGPHQRAVMTSAQTDTSWHAAYVEAFRKCRTNSGAARAAGVSVDKGKRAVKNHPELAAQIAEINKLPMPSSWTADAEPAETNDAEPNADWVPRFIEALRLCGSPRTAARLAGVEWGDIQKRIKMD